ncbi:2'-5' RNA ligase family protein [uncultured Mucilaginibacter sp.]|uniref:2'-5' RNA ligase family protein n=1 Tax=uncultured Mucilaginibacter sp. TaxID=797541 RepID=UPI00260D38A3|nr:2'-5' RNA ligase family protein [uncultured Mucilaginibacter sp.]
METFKLNPFAKLVSQDYLLVITPSEEVVSEVRKLKDFAKKLIGYYHSFNSKAHITVNHYYDGKALFFDERVPTCKSMTGRIDVFEIKICGFDFFEHQGNYTIYAKVELSQNIKAAFSRFKKVFGADVPQTPHITIARSLSYNQYKLLWYYFKKQSFECSFYADEIVVLKTPTRRFYKLPMEVETGFKLRNVV